MTIEEMKNIVEQCKKDGQALIEINNLKFSSDFEFNFNNKWEKLFIRFCAAGISGIVASIDYDEIKSINGLTMTSNDDKVSTTSTETEANKLGIDEYFKRPSSSIGEAITRSIFYTAIELAHKSTSIKTGVDAAGYGEAFLKLSEAYKTIGYEQE